MLGMVFGWCLAGSTDDRVLAAGLCASFILADGHQIGGAWLVLTESPAPDAFLCGALFMIPLWIFVWMLGQSSPDQPMKKNVEARLWRRLIASVTYSSTRPSCRDCLAYVLITWCAVCGPILLPNFEPRRRPPRGFFLKCGWLWGSCCAAVYFRLWDNRRALRHGLLAATAGLGILLISLMGLRWQWLGAAFMVLIAGFVLPTCWCTPPCSSVSWRSHAMGVIWVFSCIWPIQLGIWATSA